MSSFGQNLKKFRKEKKLSQKVLAQKLGVGQTTIANYETDFRFPNEGNLRQLADILQVSVDELLGRKRAKSVMPLVENIEERVQLFVKHMVSFEDDLAIKMVIDLAAEGYDVLDIHQYFLKETLYYVGDLWEKGQISIALEHHITSVIDQIIALLSVYLKRKPSIDKKAVFLTPSNEPHTIGLKMVREVFKAFGWKTYFLGTDLPWIEIVRLVKSEGIDLVVISITLQQNINQTQALVDYVRSNCQTTIMIGGQALHLKNQIIKRIQPDYYTESREDLNDLLKSIS